jgi:hypothetical protein
MDSFICALMLVPALRGVVAWSGIAATNTNIGFYGSILFALFLTGLGLALIWEPIADRWPDASSEANDAVLPSLQRS